MRPFLRTLLALALATPIAACTVGDLTGPGGGGSGDDTGGGDDTGDDVAGPDAAVAPDFTATMTPATLSTALNSETRYTLTLESSNFEGPVTLTATGVPATWTTSFEPSTVAMALDGTTTVQLVVQVPSNGEAMTATLGVEASGSPGTKVVSSQLVVANELTVVIPSGTATGGHQFPGRIDLKLGATLKVINSDGTLHRIHSDGGAGFPHQDNDMTQGQSYSVIPGDLGEYRFYCHIHGTGTGVTNLVVGE